MLSRGIQVEVCDKFIIHLTKVLLGVLELHPFCYLELIPMSLEFSVFYCFTEAGQPLTFERFIIQCLNLLKGILLLNDHRPYKVDGKYNNSKTNKKIHNCKQIRNYDELLE